VSFSGVVAPVEKPVWVIEPRGEGVLSRLREMGRYRRLIGHFGRLALQKIYIRTRLGILWVFIRPLFPILVGTVVFRDLVGVSSGPVPYFLFYLTGMSFWNLFSEGLQWTTRSLELNRRLLKKLYFPRLILPLSYLAPALVNLLIYGVLIVGVSFFYSQSGVFHHAPGAMKIAASLGAVAAVLALALGLGLWTSVLGADARDVRFTVGYILNFWHYFTPVIYPLSSIPESARWAVVLNPVAGLVETFKWGVLGVGHPGKWALWTALAFTGIVFVSGLVFFARYETKMLDRL
jgi:lipopolysaccharide transport system permease protein